MLGYTTAKIGDTHVVVTLEIPTDALTNIVRSGVVAHETARFRARKANVLAIEDAGGVLYSTATTCANLLTYIVGESVEEPAFNINLEDVHGRGIPFFLTHRVAELNAAESIHTGLFQSWYDSGQLRTQRSYVDGKLHGSFQIWYPTGKKYLETNYENGKIHGSYHSWYYNGGVEIVATYCNGTRYGLFRSWYEDGRKAIEELL